MAGGYKADLCSLCKLCLKLWHILWIRWVEAKQPWVIGDADVMVIGLFAEPPLQQHRPLVGGHRQKQKPQRVSLELIFGAVGQQHGLVLTAGPWFSELLRRRRQLVTFTSSLILNETNNERYWPPAVWPSSSGAWSCSSFCGESSWCCRGHRRLTGPLWCRFPPGPTSQTHNPPAVHRGQNGAKL